MVNNTIIKYLKKGLKEGHSLNSLKGALLKQGYPAADVDDAVKQISPPKAEAGKKPLIVAILVISIIAIVVVAIWVYPRLILKPPVNDTLKKIMIDGCLNGTNTEETFCLAVAKRDQSYCEDIHNDTPTKNKCYRLSLIAKAIDSGDLGVCDSANDSSLKLFCYAIVKSNSSYCDFYIEELQLSGRLKEAMLDLCKYWAENLKSSAERNSSKMCDIYKEDLRTMDTCIALTSKDNSICGSIRERECYKWYYLTLASREKDAGYCKKIVDQPERKICQLNVEYELSPFCRDLVCIAESLNDPKYCEEIENSESREECIRKF